MTNRRFFQVFAITMIIFMTIGPIIMHFYIIHNNQFNCVKDKIENLDFGLHDKFLKLTYYQVGNHYSHKKRFNMKHYEGNFKYSYQMLSENNQQILILIEAKIINNKWVIIKLQIYQAKHSLIPTMVNIQELIMEKNLSCELTCE